MWVARENEKSFRWAVSPDGSILVLNVQFHDEQDEKKHRFEFYRVGETKPFCVLFNEFTRSSNDMVFSPDGRLLAVIRNNDICLYESETAEQVAE